MIVILYPQFYGVAGIARYLDSFLANLPEGAPPMVMVTGDAPAAGQAVRHYPGVEIVHIPLGRTRFGLTRWSWRARRVLAELDRSTPITAVALHIPPMIPGLLLARRFPLVLTAHTTYEGMSGRFDGNRHFSSPWNPVSLWIKRWMEQRLIDRAERIITLTEQGRQELALYGRHERIEVVPNGVDCRQFTPVAVAEAEAAAEPAVKDIDVLFAGRIEQRKGSRPLVAVCRGLVAANPQLRITIVGYGDDEAHVRQGLADLSGAVTMLGKQPFEAMAGLYRRAHVYASTSYYEGLPGTCLEAMAAGLPAVVWDLLFYRGLVLPGRTGLLIPVNDADALVHGLLDLLQDPARMRAMGQHAQALVQARYDWRRLAGQVLGAHALPLAGPALPGEVAA